MLYKARIKFADKEWLVVENIEYKGIKYYCIVEDISDELEKLEKLSDYKGRLSVEFIYQLDNGKYKNVTDKELIEKLLLVVGVKTINRKD